MDCKFLPGDRLVCVALVENPFLGPCPLKLREIYVCKRVLWIEQKQDVFVRLHGVKFCYRHTWFEKLVDLSQFHAMCLTVPILTKSKTKEPA